MSYAIDFALASAMVLLGCLGLVVRPAWVGGVLFFAGGLGVSFLTDLILLGVPLDRSRDLLLDERFFVAWMLFFVLTQLWLRLTSSGRRLASRLRGLWERAEAHSPALGEPWDGSVRDVEEREFYYSLEAAGKWAEERKRRMAELAGEDDPK